MVMYHKLILERQHYVQFHAFVKENHHDASSRLGDWSQSERPFLGATTTRTPPYFARTPPLSPRHNPTFCARRRAQYSHKTPTFSFTPPPQLLQYVYATGSPCWGVLWARGSFDQAWTEEAAPWSSASQQRRQQASERFTQREPSGFELMSELPSTAIPDSQSSARGACQRGERGERVGGVPKVMTNVFQM